MERQELVATIKELIAREADLSVDTIDPATRLSDLDIDSLDVLRVAVALERSFGVEITTADLGRIFMLDDLVTMLQQKILKTSQV